MSDKEGSISGEVSNVASQEPCHLPETRRMFWRSASWSSSRSMLPPLNTDCDKDIGDPNGSNGGQVRRLPLTPRSKGRSCLPPLQPLSISRRSLDEWPKAGSDDVGEWPVPTTPSGRTTGERLKLDLSTIQRSSDKNGGLVKREKIAFFDKECSKVADHVYLGGDAVAKDKDILKKNGITHILNCVGFACPEYFKANFTYRTLWLQDSPSEDITSILYDVFDYFEDVRELGGKVFVHCCQGVSRSTSLVIAYLMWREGQSFDDAFQYVKAARGIADPNMGFACQLLQCQKRVHAIPLSPSSLLRLYRIAPHSPYDPLHLVPKLLNDPTPSALDSRGAFIIHVPSAIYVWIGDKCETILERDARGAVCQIVRYEKVQGPVQMIKEGEEPPYFWDAFSSLLPMMNKSCNGDDIKSKSKICPGERKVDSYDLDFEIFRKAIMGGFVPPFSSYETEGETHLPARENSWSTLRRRFAFGNMKDFVSASKLSVLRIYPEAITTAGVDNSTAKSASSSAHESPSSISLSSSSSSTSSSSPYLSPDSISSDSSVSSKSLMNSPAMSTTTLPCSSPQFSILPGLSNLSLASSKISPKSITKTSDFIDVNFMSVPRSHSISSSTKRSPLSIAQRRGSLSKCLTLPTRPEDIVNNNFGSSFLSSEEDSVNEIGSDCTYSFEIHKTENHMSKGELCLSESFKLDGDTGKICGVHPCDEPKLVSENSDGGCRDIPLRNFSIGSNETMANSLAICNAMHVSAYRWPNLEKIVGFRAGCLDSDSLFVFIWLSSSSSVTDDRIVYIWIGRSFDYSKYEVQLGSNREFTDINEFDLKQVASHVLTQLGLPEDTQIQMVKQDEEPENFTAMLSLL
ncbi:protein-tyrosine-phosphatase MKP1 [Impatiens glandulifera]|uniref:protein-tyrosine-phosphatase MKP1 n=1 Tax=Impatiens glandulifera TaxID=253017 RepID=UPI001FB137E8|nr:protein-tyrosine-phosphatase MKP1 [Impatiens glandulifera]